MNENRKEAIIKFLKKHIVGEIILLLIVLGLIALKIFNKQISFHLKLAIQDKPNDAKRKKKPCPEDNNGM